MTGVEDLFVQVAGENPVIQALVGGFVIALLNTFGAVLVIVWQNPSERFLDSALGFAAGVMLSASFTSLILPGIELGGIYPVIIGFGIGVLFLDQADYWVPHVHVAVTGRVKKKDNVTDKEREDVQQGLADAKMKSVILFIVAITIHNMPEGLAVGVGFGTGNLEDAIPLMLAIGIQNIPEGLAVSVAAVNAGLGKSFYAGITGIRAGLVEIPVAVFGALAVSVAEPVLPYAMGFAAGGMLFVISDEIVPETHSRGNERMATMGMMVGVVVMLYLDIVLAG